MRGKMARKRKIPVVWDIQEKIYFKELILEIKSRSENLATQIKERVRESIEQIQYYPMLFEVDSLKVNNDGSYRKFVAIHIRITYKIEPDKIIIVRIRHSASEPLDY
ncbi:MAG: type II toxin-antitoxin system RelE/ParE family toxin [Bacteroidia bacterium]